MRVAYSGQPLRFFCNWYNKILIVRCDFTQQLLSSKFVAILNGGKKF